LGCLLGFSCFGFVRFVKQFIVVGLLVFLGQSVYRIVGGVSCFVFFVRVCR